MVIGIANHKGGTGKTTTAMNLSFALVNEGKKVLLIDFDPQANLTYSFEKSDSFFDVSHVIKGEKSIQDVILKFGNLDFVPASMQLSDIELSMQLIDNREFVLKEILDNHKNNYDYILIDCPPSRSLLTLNALVSADYVVVPILLDVLSIQGVVQILNTVTEIKQILNYKLDLLGILAVNVDMRKKLSKDVFKFIQQNINHPIFKSMIRTNTKIAEAPSHGLSVIEYAKNSNGAKDFKKLAEEIISLNK